MIPKVWGELLVRLMDWLAGLAAPTCVMKVKLVGLRVKGDRVEGEIEGVGQLSFRIV